MGIIGKAIKLGLGYISLRAITGFVKAATELASDLTEVQNVVDVTFGSMAKDINDFASTALDNFGLSELSAKKFASTMGAMLKSSGLTGESVKNMSIELTKLTADMASFYNLKPEEAFQKIRAGISGETEPLKQLGINMSVANMQAYALAQGITRKWQAMSQAEQTMLRYNYLLSVTKDAQGDFARNVGTWANQTKILTEQWNALKATIGAGFINILMPVVKWLNAIIKRIQIAAEYFKAFTRLIFGDAQVSSGGGVVLSDVSDSLGDAEEGYNNVGSSAGKAAKDTEKAAKKMKNALAGFDEINKLEKVDNSGSDDTGAGGVGSGIDALGIDGLGESTKVDLGQFQIDAVIDNLSSNIIDKLKNIKNFLGQYFAPEIQLAQDVFAKLGDEAVGAFKRIGDYAKERFGPLKETLTNYGMTILSAYKNIAEPLIQFFGYWASLAISSFEGMTKAIIGIFSSLVTGIIHAISPGITLISEIIKTFLESLNSFLSVHLEEIRAFILDFWDTLRQGVEDIISGIAEVIHQIFAGLLNWWRDNCNDVKDLLIRTWETIWNGLQTVWTIIKDVAVTIFNAISSFLKDNADEIGGFIAAAWNLIYTVLSSIWEMILKAANTIFNNLKAFWDKWGKDIINIFNAIWKIISDFFGDFLETVTHLFNAFAALFKGDWNKLWEEIKLAGSSFWNAIKTLLQNIWEAIKAIASALWKAIKEEIIKWWENIQQGISNTKNNLINAVKEPFEVIKNFISNIIKEAYDWGKNLIGNIVDGVKSSVGKVKDAAKSVASTISNYLGFHSPTKEGPGSDADKWMPNMIQMFADGIYSNMGKIKSAVSYAAHNLSELSNIQTMPNLAISGIGNYNDPSLLEEFDITGMQQDGNTTIIIKVGEDTLTEKVISNINRQNRIAGKTVIEV
ncbi:hypothetical protein [Defluviitalea saccharophila]|uniref:Uncharacterized protein n=1 Tax=Defluviitalea saccharophila TaxID=879970 RepID=A0ABZ2Y5K9_9FIRM